MNRWTGGRCFLVVLGIAGSAIAQGDGTFRFPLQIAVPNPAVGITGGDFNRDGKMDLALAHGTGQLSILLQDPVERRRFNRGSLDVGLTAFFVRAADLDGDGDQDLVVADPGTSGYVSLCRGDGTFDRPRSLSEAPAPRWVVAEDLDGDGRLDLAFACRNHGLISIYLGAGGGSFTFLKSLNNVGEPHTLDTVDLDADGRADLLAGVHLPGPQQAGILPLLNLGGGDFAVGGLITELGPCHNALATGDFNGDGLLDVTNECVAAVSLGNGSFRGVLEPGGAETLGVAVGDLDGDGLADLAVPGELGEKSLLVHRGSARGDFLPPLRFGPFGGDRSSAFALRIEDLDADGRADLIFGDWGTPLLGILWGVEEGLFDSGRLVRGFDGARDLEIADLDGDRRPELVLALDGQPSLQIYPPDGINSALAVDTLKSFSALEVADLDGDGAPDFAGTNFSSGEVLVVLLSPGGKVRAESALTAGNYAALVRVGRLDAGETADLLAVSTGSSELTVFLGLGGGVFADARRVATVPLPRSAALGDLDGDGRVDVTVATTGEVAVQYGDGAGGFGPPVTVDRDPKKKYVQVAIADLDGDGREELLAAETKAARGLLVFLAREGRRFEPAGARATGVELSSFVLADLDGDRLSDLTGTSNIDRSLSVFLNRGALNFSTPTVYRVGFPLLGHRVADLDGDGVLDLVCFSPNEAVILPGRAAKAAPGTFRRGDVDSDGAMLLTDAVLILLGLFLGQGPPGCPDAADADDDGALGISDPITILNRLFLGGRPLPPPGPEVCGSDPTADGLPACGGCAR